MKDYIWVTADNKLIDIREMDSGHLFNILKMLYNHLARLGSLPEVWFSKEYDFFYKMWNQEPQQMINMMKLMIEEMEKRIKTGDLSGGRLFGYEIIRISLTGELHSKIIKTVKQLEERKEIHGQQI